MNHPLPEEIIAHILGFLPARGLISTERAAKNHWFSAIVRGMKNVVFPFDSIDNTIDEKMGAWCARMRTRNYFCIRERTLPWAEAPGRSVWAFLSRVLTEDAFSSISSVTRMLPSAVPYMAHFDRFFDATWRVRCYDFRGDDQEQVFWMACRAEQNRLDDPGRRVAMVFSRVPGKVRWAAILRAPVVREIRIASMLSWACEKTRRRLAALRDATRETPCDWTFVIRALDRHSFERISFFLVNDCGAKRVISA